MEQKWSQSIQATLQYLLFKKSFKTQIFTNDSENKENQQGKKKEKNNEKEEEIKKSKQSKEQESQLPDINNLITVDVGECLTFFWIFLTFIVALLRLAMTLSILYYKVGNLMFLGLYIILGAFFLNLLISTFSMYCYGKVYEAKDARVSVSKDVIEGIKSIKYLCWEEIFQKKIFQLRGVEFKFIVFAKILQGIFNIFWGSISYIILCILLTQYNNKGDNKLQDFNVFTIIALFGQLTFPLAIIPWALGFFFKIKVSYDRIQRYLNQREINMNNIITFENNNNRVNFNYENDQNSISTQFNNLVVFQNTLNIVIGQIGCGKSALLNCILNEMDSKSQKRKNDQSSLLSFQKNQDQEKLQNLNYKIQINGTLAYVSQNHWLQAKTIKENILFGQYFDQDWYNQCVEVCDLHIDFSYFTKKDEKILSSGGNNLSGGQKQRICICRAIYSNRDIYIFDDIFSSLDAHVAEKIYQKAIIGLLIKKLKKTVIFATSHYGILKDRQFINQIIYIQNAQIVQNQNLIEEFITNSIQNEIEKQQYEKQQQQKIIQVKDEDENFQNEEEIELGGIKWLTIRQYLKSMNYFIFFIFLISFIASQSSQMLIDFWLKDYVSKEYHSYFFKKLNELFDNDFSRIFFFLIGLNLIFNLFNSLLFIVVNLISSFRMFQKLNKKIIFSKMSFFDMNPSGRIINRISSDIQQIDDGIPFTFNQFFYQLILVSIYPLGILINFPWIAIPFVFCVCIMYYFFYLFRFSNRELKRLSQVNNGKLMTIINENCSGLIITRSFNQQNYMMKDYLQKLEDYINSTLVTRAMQLWLLVRVLITSNIIYIFVCGTCLVIIYFDISVDYNIIAMCLAYSILFSGGFSELLYFQASLEQNLISAERIVQYFKNKTEKVNETNQNNDNLIEELSDEEKQENYSIIFKDLYITYDDIINVENFNKDSKDVHFALKNINLKIKKGEKIAFCGRTGSGKTSILNIIFGLYPFQFGNVFIENKNIKLFSLKDLRQKMSIIPQFGFLYNNTLKDNLDPSGSLLKEEIQQKMDSTNLRINRQDQQKQNQEDNEQVGNDLNFVIEDGGKNLSNGQKQIINFLRIVLRDTDIICLDEATSNMDPQTDQEIHDQLFKLSENKTLIVITHRLENIDKFDRIVVLDNGNIIECGNIKELRQINNGFFNKQLQQQN
ncbi:hypothetical protein IMG5_149230 [Ichthyophthirius multifiliis]|uniref:ABC transporter family protein n=1 Tax=Ichthyophthirius multifiliis TaxID=5932 RepID=G0QYF4_ICHMU|nr:hypothetical protein IMG5_149230 [Ichthyophthirius multifiliis]EGR29740.1 hypothetical protein IMG5_149230 [Ichthyophthirius multifiliis]|eukprot:XP_004030976.1 hypothetical protein IMG5_149230 [Ichthyophthirius multifiliis]